MGEWLLKKVKGTVPQTRAGMPVQYLTMGLRKRVQRLLSCVENFTGCLA